MSVLRPVLAATLMSLSACTTPADDNDTTTTRETADTGETPATTATSSPTTTSPTSGEATSGVSDSHGTGGDPTTTTADTTGDPSPWHGEPLPPEVPGSWMWVDVPESRCRDGSATGIGVRYGTGDTLAIFFEGGGACFNASTCLLNDAFLNFNALSFQAWQASLGQGGVFASDNPDNPVADWNFIYVPYCTGDVHAGDRTDVGIDGVLGAQQFVGYRNVAHYLDRIVPTFADAPHVLVTGQSAGGFGAAFNYDRIADAFPDARVTLLDDSGPPFRDMFLAPCLQERWRELWNIDTTLPIDCDDCFNPNGGGISNLAVYLGAKYPDQRLTLLSAVQDSIIRTFFASGKNDCAGGIMTGAEFESGLDDLRSNVFVDAPTWGSYLMPGIGHTILSLPTYATTEVNGIRLTDWLTAVLNGQATHVAP